MSNRGVTGWCALSLFALNSKTVVAQTEAVDVSAGGAPAVSASAPTVSGSATEVAETEALKTEALKTEASATAPEPMQVEPPTPVDAPEVAGEVITDEDTSRVGAAERALAEVDFTAAVRLAVEALAAGNLDASETRRIYRVYAIAAAQLGRTAEATEAFKRLFALEPHSNIDRRLSPTRRNPALDARGFWDLHKGEFQTEVLFDRQMGQVVVRTHDALGWFRQVDVVSRVDGGSYRRRRKQAGREIEFEEPISSTSTVEVFVEVFDAHGNLLQRVGDERMPLRFAPSSEELANSTRDIRGGQTGSFGRRLEELGANVGVHGFVTAELRPEDGEVTFDVHHATVWFRAELMKRASLEFGIEVEHLLPEIEDLYVPHAFIDLGFTESVNARVGLFEAPVGAFNEYLYPDFLRTTALPPLYTQDVIPALWSEVGIQLRGRVELGESKFLTYAAFVSNGLEQADPTPGDGEVAEGGTIRAMRFNRRDQHDSSKAGGGRVGYEAGPLDIGVSGYRGRYTIDAARYLTLLDVDASFRLGNFTTRGEAALALQEVTGRTLKKYGGYVLGAYRVVPHLEVYAQYDNLTVEGTQHRALLGTALYPFPESQGTRSLRLKAEAGPSWLPDADEANWSWFTQLTTGF